MPTRRLPRFRRDFPLGADQRVMVLDEEDRYAGIVLGRPRPIADANDEHGCAICCTTRDTVLLPQMTIKEAVAMFEKAESDALVVVDGPRPGT